MLPLITLEEHYTSSGVVAAKANAKNPYHAYPASVIAKLNDISDYRVKDLDSSNVAIQVISHSPGDYPLDVCRAGNDELAAAVSKHPSRLSGFAMLPMSEPVSAAQELERCIKDHGFVGALVDNHAKGKFYDDEKFWCVFEKTEELDVPLYIHPTYAPEEDMERYKGNYISPIAGALSAYAWGWHADTGLHFLRLYSAGVFDRFPKLKIILGHMGEMIPFQLERCIAIAQHFGKKRSLREVWRNNVWITTSGMFTLAPLRCLVESTTKDRVLFSIDYPFSANEKGRAFVEQVEKSGIFTENEMKGFAYGNAEKLLRVRIVESKLNL